MARDPFQEFVEEFKNESDRAAVILGAAKLDYLLYEVLTRYLMPITSRNDELLEGDAPLATFSSRIQLCYRLGLIDTNYTRALNLVRRIRNSFAHEVSGCKLDSGAHRDRVRELVGLYVKEPAFQDFKEVFIHGKEGVAADFCAMLGLLVFGLEMLRDNVQVLTKPTPLSLSWPNYKSRRFERDDEGNLKRLDRPREPISNSQ